MSYDGQSDGLDDSLAFKRTKRIAQRWMSQGLGHSFLIDVMTFGVSGNEG